jgi:lipoic acid synthetase
VDRSEPERVGEAVARWGLRYVVLTQVCRDDLPDGGAAMMGASVRSIRSRTPKTLVELLTGDLAGSSDSLRTLLEARPEVLAHNLETVRRLSPQVRDPRASYDGSLQLLRSAREWGAANLVTKSSIMIGLGETDEELDEAFGDLRAAGVQLLTLGQYLRPTPAHRPVARYLPPDGFDRLADRARSAGFSGVEAGPLVRSSYRAEALYRSAREGSGV